MSCLWLGLALTSLWPCAWPCPLTLPWSLPLVRLPRRAPLTVPGSLRQLPPRPTLCWVLRLVVLAVAAATRWGAHAANPHRLSSALLQRQAHTHRPPAVVTPVQVGSLPPLACPCTLTLSTAYLPWGHPPPN